jgi:hypothetical protein
MPFLLTLEDLDKRDQKSNSTAPTAASDSAAAVVIKFLSSLINTIPAVVQKIEEGHSDSEDIN